MQTKKPLKNAYIPNKKYIFINPFISLIGTFFVENMSNKTKSIESNDVKYNIIVEAPHIS